MAYAVSDAVTSICKALNDPYLDKYDIAGTYVGRARVAFVDAFYSIIGSGQYNKDDISGVIQIKSGVTIASTIDLTSNIVTNYPYYKLIDIIPGTNVSQIKIKEIKDYYRYLKNNSGNSFLSEYVLYYREGNVLYFPTVPSTKLINIIYISGIVSKTDVTGFAYNTNLLLLMSPELISRCEQMAVATLRSEV